MHENLPRCCLCNKPIEARDRRVRIMTGDAHVEPCQRDHAAKVLADYEAAIRDGRHTPTDFVPAGVRR
jgi:hypothetical protein